jgi:hypothetical protein
VKHHVYEECRGEIELALLLLLINCTASIQIKTSVAVSLRQIISNAGIKLK